MPDIFTTHTALEIAVIEADAVRAIRRRRHDSPLVPSFVTLMPRTHARTHAHTRKRVRAHTHVCREHAIIRLTGVVVLCLEAGFGEQRYTPHRHLDVVTGDTLSPSLPTRSIPQRAESDLPLGHPCAPQAAPPPPSSRAAPRLSGTNRSRSTAGCRPPKPALATRARARTHTHTHARAHTHTFSNTHSHRWLRDKRVWCTALSFQPTANSSPRCSASVCISCARVLTHLPEPLSLSLATARCPKALW